MIKVKNYISKILNKIRTPLFVVIPILTSVFIFIIIMSHANPLTDFSSLQIVTINQGDGEAAKNGDTIKVHYTGTLINGTKFDSSLDRGEPFESIIGQGQVIE